MYFDINFDKNIKKRKNFDAIIEREIIAIQNICFRDVTINVTNNVSKNEIFEIMFNELINNININIDLFN